MHPGPWATCNTYLTSCSKGIHFVNNVECVTIVVWQHAQCPLMLLTVPVDAACCPSSRRAVISHVKCRHFVARIRYDVYIQADFPHVGSGSVERGKVEWVYCSIIVRLVM